MAPGNKTPQGILLKREEGARGGGGAWKFCRLKKTCTIPVNKALLTKIIMIFSCYQMCPFQTIITRKCVISPTTLHASSLCNVML